MPCFTIVPKHTSAHATATMAATHAACDPASCSSPFSALPVALLAHVLQHVPQQQRLTSCALVRRDWAAAAAAGTLSIKCQRLDSSKCESVGTWIQKHGTQLVSLQLATWQLAATPTKPQLQLPCAALRQLTALQLSGLQVQQPAPDQTTAGAGSITTDFSLPSQHMPKLQDLLIGNCVFDSASSLLQLGPFTAMKELSLIGLQFVSPLDSGLPGSPQSSEAQRLSQTRASAAVLGLLPRMAQLKRLHLSQDIELEVWAAATLPPSITSLNLSFWWDSKLPLPRSLQQLGALQELSVHTGRFCPAALAALSQLRALELFNCTLLPDAAGVDGATVLLEAVGRMQQLQSLVIPDSNTLTTARPHCCSALTASSHLTQLQLTCEDDQPLPAGAVGYMFPAGRSRPQLQRLYLSCMVGDAPFMTGAELAAMVSACPSLTILDITDALQPGESCDGLLQLPPTCRQLSIGGDAFGDSAAATVAQLTQLTYLGWFGSCSLTDGGLYQLTALQGLQTLCLQDDHALSDGLVYKEDGFMCDALSLTAAAKPVCEQLQDRIRACPGNALWIALLDRQHQEMQRLQQANTQLLLLQQANKQLQEQVQQLQQANTQQQQEIQQLRQSSTIRHVEPAAAQPV